MKVLTVKTPINDYQIRYDNCMGYSLLKGVRYPSGTIAFYQQIGKYYMQPKRICDLTVINVLTEMLCNNFTPIISFTPNETAMKMTDYILERLGE